jgi:3-hydroxyacyl-CoA dehydrogenase/enoyl-CoA hydratase/3-hydroxybutyryl-CoA epimerase
MVSAIDRTTAWEGFADVDLVIEAVVEELETKRAVFRELEQRTPAQGVLATNTSSLSVAALQEGATHPGRIAGFHFFNPVHKMPLVEVVRAPATEEQSVAALVRLAVKLGKIPVVVRDSPGFLVNRILMPYLNEAMQLAADDMPVTLIDGVMCRFGMPMGPLELLDQVGIDVAAHVAVSMEPILAARFPPNHLLNQMHEKGWLGQKNGTGFYIYKGRKKEINPGLQELASCRRSSAGNVSDDEARDRMVLLMVNEAALCLAEGVAGRAETVDMAMVFGTGWAPHRGGPLHYAEDRGIKDVVVRLRELAEKLGPRFEPCPELCRRAAAPADSSFFGKESAS